jgi:hypothetical protein
LDNPHLANHSHLLAYPQLEVAYLEIHPQLRHSHLEMLPLEQEGAFSEYHKQPARSRRYLARVPPQIKISLQADKACLGIMAALKLKPNLLLDNYLAPKLPQVHKVKAFLELSNYLDSNRIPGKVFSGHFNNQELNLDSRLHNLDQLQLNQLTQTLLAAKVLVAKLSSPFLDKLNRPCFQEELVVLPPSSQAKALS